MKRKNKGFTMVELLITIVVLALILSFTIPSVIVLINREKDASDELVLTNIEKAASLYTEEYPENIKWEDTGDGIRQTCLTIKEIKDKGYLKSIAPNKLDEYNLSKKVLVTIDASSVKTYEIIEESGTCVFDSGYPSVSIDNIITTTKSITYDLSCSNEKSNLYYIEYNDLNTNETVRVYVDNSKTISQNLTFTNLKNDNTLNIKAKCVNKGRKEANTSLSKNLDDITAPVIVVDSQGWTKEKTVTITYSDPKNNLEHNYRMNATGSWNSVKDGTLATTGNNLVYTYTYDTPGEHIIQAQTTDGTNNKSNNLTVSLIDTTPPSCSTTKSSGSTNGVTVIVTGTDNASGFGTSTNNVLTKDFIYNNVKTSGSYTVTDAAGNTGTCDVTVSTKTVSRTCSSCTRCSSASCTSWGTESYNCSYCYTGDPSVCVGGYVTDSCASTKTVCKTCSYTEQKCEMITTGTCYGNGGSCSSGTNAGWCEGCCVYSKYGANCSKCGSKKECVPGSVYDPCKSTTSTCEYGCDTRDVCNQRAADCAKCGCSSWGSWSEVASCSASSSMECSTSYY